MDATTDAKPRARDGLSGFATKADDLDEIKKSVNDAASTSGALWLSYLFVLLYTAVAAGSVTATDLFMENTVKLPFLSVDLPLKAFFFLAPVLFLLTHVYTLVSFVILSDRAKWYHRELGRQIDAAGFEDPAQARDVQDDLRRHLVGNIFVQFLAGPGDLRQGPFGFVIKLIVWTTLVFAPIALLLEVQVQFLPFHDALITWTHRVVLLLDIVAVWWLGYRILAGRFSENQTWHRLAAGSAQAGVVVACVVALVFSWTIATFGELPQTSGPEETASTDRREPSAGQQAVAFLHDYFFNGDVDPKSRRRTSYFSDTLVLSGFDIYKNLKIDDRAKLASQRAIFSARSRDFAGAVFDLSDLSQVDFEGAILTGASFDQATMRSASFYCAHMERAILNNAHIEAAWFHAADLTDAKMEDVKGVAARFEGANLTDAKMHGAVLQATTFDGANLTNANLASASLRGASLASPMLDKTCEKAKSPQPSSTAAVVLANTDFTGADLGLASLQGADLTKVASIGCAKLDYADLTGATVSEEKLSCLDAGSNKRRVSVDKLQWDSDVMARSVATDGMRASQGVKLVAPSEGRSEYSRGLAKNLRELVCTGIANSPFIALGLVLNQRIATVGESTPAIVDVMVEGDCATNLDLPSDRKADLVALRRAASLGEAR